MSALTDAMQEYANCIRGDWSDFDGRSERDVIESWIAEINDPQGITLEEWRNRLGMCADGNGHWHGVRWGNCWNAEQCPTAYAEHDEWLEAKRLREQK